MSSVILSVGLIRTSYLRFRTRCRQGYHDKGGNMKLQQILPSHLGILCAGTTRLTISKIQRRIRILTRIRIFGAIWQILRSESVFSLEPSSGRSNWVEYLFSASSAMTPEQQRRGNKESYCWATRSLTPYSPKLKPVQKKPIRSKRVKATRFRRWELSNYEQSHKIHDDSEMNLWRARPHPLLHTSVYSF
jgi:hypothetical protein